MSLRILLVILGTVLLVQCRAQEEVVENDGEDQDSGSEDADSSSEEGDSSSEEGDSSSEDGDSSSEEVDSSSEDLDDDLEYEMHGQLAMTTTSPGAHSWTLQPPDHSATGEKTYTLILNLLQINIPAGTEIELDADTDEGVVTDQHRCVDFLLVHHHQHLCGVYDAETNDPFNVTIEHVKHVKVSLEVVNDGVTATFNATYDWRDETLADTDTVV